MQFKFTDESLYSIKISVSVDSLIKQKKPSKHSHHKKQHSHKKKFSEFHNEENDPDSNKENLSRLELPHDK